MEGGKGALRDERRKGRGLVRRGWVDRKGEKRNGGEETETGRGQEERRMAKAKEEGKKRTFPTSY